jgi:hypothetical protein
MVSLIAVLSSGKGTWAQVNALVKCSKWDKIYFICNDYAFENYDANGAIKLKFDENKILESMNKLSQFFKKDVKDFEVALNVYSGSGIEHMAVISAVLKAGLGMRFVYENLGELCEFEILDEKFDPDFEDTF